MLLVIAYFVYWVMAAKLFIKLIPSVVNFINKHKLMSETNQEALLQPLAVCLVWLIGVLPLFFVK